MALSAWQGEPSIWGTVRVQMSATGGLHLKATEGFKASLVDNGEGLALETMCGTQVVFQAPVRSHQALHNTPIQALHTSSSGALAVSGSSNGELLVWETENGAIRRVLNSHTGDVTACRFFPSDEVVLSGASDCRIKIWSVATGENPVTLTGHTRSISGLAVIDRGRNVLSCSWDGTLKLWDCGSAACLSTPVTYDGKLTGMHLTADLSAPLPAGLAEGSDEEKQHVREVGTEGKFVVCAASTGQAIVVDLRQKTFALASAPGHGAPLSSIVMAAPNIIAAGDETGCISVWDVRQPRYDAATLNDSCRVL